MFHDVAADDFEGEIPDLSIPPKAGPLRAP